MPRLPLKSGHGWQRTVTHDDPPPAPAAGIALIVSLFGTKFLIFWLTKHRIGQPIHEDVPRSHHQGGHTPTMGASPSCPAG